MTKRDAKQAKPGNGREVPICLCAELRSTWKTYPPKQSPHRTSRLICSSTKKTSRSDFEKDYKISVLFMFVQKSASPVLEKLRLYRKNLCAPSPQTPHPWGFTSPDPFSSKGRDALRVLPLIRQARSQAFQAPKNLDYGLD
jgi:hypothetical protein